MDTVNDTIKNWPYSVWNSISRCLTNVLVEDKSGLFLGKVTKLFDDLSKKGKLLLVPFRDVHSKKYKDIFEDCKAFNTWLFGQLIAVYASDRLEVLRVKCLELQVTLLRNLYDNDCLLFDNISICFINMLEDLIRLLEKQEDSLKQAFVFKWFQFTCSQQLELLPIEFKISNDSVLFSYLNLAIEIFVSQTTCISHSCPSLRSLLWQYALVLLKKYQQSCPKLSIYKFISYLIEETILPSASSRFDATLSELLISILNDISTLCQIGKLPNEDEFSSMLRLLTKKLDNDLNFDYCYLETLYSVLLQSTPSSSEIIADSVHQYFDKLLQLSEYKSVSRLLESNIYPNNVPLLVILTRHSLKDNICCIPEKKSPLILYQSYEHWRYLLEQLMDLLQLQNVSSSQQLYSTLKNIQKVSQLAADITRVSAYNIIFFRNDDVPRILQSLVGILKTDWSKKTLSLILEIVRDLQTLEEAQNYDEKTFLMLQTFLTLSWLPNNEGMSSTDSFPQKYLSCVDAEIRELCITSLMSCSYRFRFDTWKDKFCDEIFKNLSENILTLLPVFIHSLSDFDREILLRRMLNSGNDLLTELSFNIRFIVCALDTRYSCEIEASSSLRIQCSKCDDRISGKVDETNEINTVRSQNLGVLIVNMLASSDKAKCNVLESLVDLFNHVVKSEELLNELRKCFLSDNTIIKKKIVQVTPYIIFKDPSSPPYEYSKDIFDGFIKCFYAFTLESLTAEEADTQYVCLNAVLKIGYVPLEETLLPCISILLNMIINASSCFPSLAKSYVQQIAMAHNIEVEDLIYLKYRECIFPLVAQIMVHNRSIYKISLTSLPCECPSVFNVLTVNYILQYFLPHVAKNPEVRPVIEELASVCDVTVPQMLRNAFRYIFPHVMLFETSEVTKGVMEILYKETNNTLSDLLSCCVTKVLAELFIQYEQYEERVKWALTEIKVLASSTKSEVSLSNQVPDSSIENFLQPRFFGVLMKLENQMCVDLICSKTRRRVLSSFKSLIRFMSSSYITSVRFKVLFTLRTITEMEKNKWPEYCIDIWDTFVRKVDGNSFNQILSTIFVSLLPFVCTFKQRVNEIFRYLIIENKNTISVDHLMELYFLERGQCEEDIFEQIEDARSRLSVKSLEEKLEWLLKMAKHEVTEIKLNALSRLKRELAVNRTDISRLILASDSVNRLVFRLLDVLIEGFRNLDTNVQQVSGDCLGEFGAIDPSYIPNMVIKEDESKKYNCYEIDDTEFVLQAFTLLCRGFQMAKSSANSDTFALALQSLLTSYKVTQSNECQYWKNIPEHLHHIIQPFYSTTYTLLTHNNEVGQEIPHLIYGSRKSLTVQKWAYNWSTFLISLLPADSKAKEIFTYCKGPMSCEIKCMYLFLPHILLHAVLSSDEENICKIYEEMISVVKQDLNTCFSGNGHAQLSTVKEPTSTQLMISEELSVISNSDQEMGVICTKTIFKLLDVLSKKFRDMRCSSQGLLNAEAIKLKTFLGKFCKFQLAQKSFDRKEYVRSLLYLEEYLGENNIELEETHLALLAKIYFHLNDVDNVKGLFAAHNIKLHQLQNVIKLHEITDQFQDAAICYQQLLKTSSAEVDEERALFYEKRTIQCYLAMNQPETALRFVNSLSSMNLENLFHDVECEALWNLSQFDKLEKITTCSNSTEDENWGGRIGLSLVHLLKDNRQGLNEEFRRIRGTLTKSLHMSTAALGGYRECYEHTVKLHILNEFEKVADLVFDISGSVDIEDWQRKFTSVVQIEFDERLRKLQPTSRVLQPVLSTRQVLFNVAGRRLRACGRANLTELFNEEMRRCRLKVIEMANRTRNFQLAYSNIVAIDNYELKGFFIEKAKYYWEKTEQQEALRTLQHGLRLYYPDYKFVKAKPQWPDEDRRICAEALMLLGSYNDAVANSDNHSNLIHFEKASIVWPESERTLMKLAEYYEKINAVKDPFAHPEICYEVVRCYGKSLMYGCEFIYQSLSRMLSVWLDLAECWNRDQRQNAADMQALQEKRRRCLQSMNERIRRFLANLPTYYFLTTFSLIMSRIMHPVTECFDLLQQIVMKCALAYPNQSLWQFTSMYRPRSSGSEKYQIERVNRILNHKDMAALSSLVNKFKELFAEFSNLCLASKKKNLSVGNTTVKVLAGSSSKLLNSNYFSDILIPAQKFMTMVLPRSAYNRDGATGAENLVNSQNRMYNPFPETMVNIVGVQEEAVVYSSMQKPVMVTLVGTDGRTYPMIFKATDDLRIDSRAMEFNAVVNMYLKRDAEARNRALYVRTYTVLPLFETNGIIEFVPNLDTMRNVCSKMRRSLGLREVQTRPYRCELKDTIEKKRENFRKLLELHKPVLHVWFKVEFPNPSSWYTARTCFVRTTAVISIVGYMLGLGDRHNDNILFDRTNGDVVHVDFNALFNKGETLPWPERVPFRLTHSMVKTMGPLGYEGGFRYTCEIVNRVIRSRKDQLISVLNTFQYDPPASLAESSRSRKPTAVIELAKRKIRDVEARMNGVVRVPFSDPSMPLSVQGQIGRLIEEATSEDNLCQMFLGWAAHV